MKMKDALVMTATCTTLTSSHKHESPHSISQLSLDIPFMAWTKEIRS
jgi:hypothetical protein